MSADLLRKAATILRERAERSMPAPWELDSREDGRAWIRMAPDGADGITAHGYPNTAAYIATMHPGVGLALADVLDDVAEKHADGGIEELVLHPDDPCEVCEHGAHEVNVCTGCYPLWEDMQAHAVYPCAEMRRILPLARLIVGAES